MDQSAEVVEAGSLPIRPNHSEVVPSEEVIGSVTQKNIDYLPGRKKSLQTRYFYGSIFMVVNLSAWFIRDYGQRILSQLHFLKACGVGGRDCFHSPGVLRVSLGCFIFFFLMFLTTCQTRKLYEARNTWHSGCWKFKSSLLIVSMVAPFFLSTNFIQVYGSCYLLAGELARLGAGIFLALQLISVIEFITWWNSYWMPDEEMKRSCTFGLFMSTLFYIASICGIVLMFPLYALTPSCTLNIFFIAWTAILLVVMMVISLHPKVNRGLLSSGIMASYIVFLCWSAIRSEPATEMCNTQHQANGSSDWTMILSFLIAICAIVMATFSTGIDSKSFQFRKDKVQLEDDIPYKYGFFHLVFSLGAMYFAMLFINWNLDHSTRKWSIDVGWTSTWVKIINEWFAASIYLWKLISPVVREAKVVDHQEPVHPMNDSALP